MEKNSKAAGAYGWVDLIMTLCYKSYLDGLSAGQAKQSADKFTKQGESRTQIVILTLTLPLSVLFFMVMMEPFFGKPM